MLSVPEQIHLLLNYFSVSLGELESIVRYLYPQIYQDCFCFIIKKIIKMY